MSSYSTTTITEEPEEDYYCSFDKSGEIGSDKWTGSLIFAATPTRMSDHLTRLNVRRYCPLLSAIKYDNDDGDKEDKKDKKKRRKKRKKTIKELDFDREQEQEREVDPMADGGAVKKAYAKGPEEVSLPQTFAVKYLGTREASGLWGVKHTRKPVDDMVATARALKPGIPLPLLDLTVDEKGVYVKPNKGNQSERFPAGPFNVDSISYGVQDLMYTRVFAMIVVGPAGTDPIATPTQPAQPKTPFTCYGFVCESRSEARQLTFSLSRTFQEYSKVISAAEDSGIIIDGAKGRASRLPKPYAIDLRTPEQIKDELKNADSTEA